MYQCNLFTRTHTHKQTNKNMLPHDLSELGHKSDYGVNLNTICNINNNIFI